MEPAEPHGPDGESARSRPVGGDVLRDLEARLDRASQAAERLLAEATARAVGAAAAPRRTAASETSSDPGDPTPAAGWQAPETEVPRSAGELELLIGLLSTLRELVPPELQRRLAEALRELLLAVRALIDWYLERAERRRTEPSEVQDIPIQ